MTQKIYKATVRWFDRLSGQGSVDIAEINERLPLYACNIKGKKTWFPHTACVYFDKNDEIEVYIDHGLVCSTTPGKFDSEAWAALDQDRLAFKCNEDGELVNGLFCLTNDRNAC